jgi:hypothetical protein
VITAALLSVESQKQKTWYGHACTHLGR